MTLEPIAWAGLLSAAIYKGRVLAGNYCYGALPLLDAPLTLVLPLHLVAVAIKATQRVQ